MKRAFFLQVFLILAALSFSQNMPNVQWQDKWLYIRTSFDYPITFYELIKNDKVLYKGIGAYNGSISSPDRVMPLDNKIVAMPGFTMGVEVQLFKHFSFGNNYLLFFGDPKRNAAINFEIDAEFLFPFNIFNFRVEPYIAASMPIYPSFFFDSDVFPDYPIMAAGGGVQLGTMVANNGIIFLDVKYLYSFSFFGDAVMDNPYGDLYPKPEQIHFRRSLLVFGIGYKYGAFIRKERSAKEPKEREPKEEKPPKRRRRHIFYF